MYWDLLNLPSSPIFTWKSVSPVLPRPSWSRSSQQAPVWTFEMCSHGCLSLELHSRVYPSNGFIYPHVISLSDMQGLSLLPLYHHMTKTTSNCVYLCVCVHKCTHREHSISSDAKLSHSYFLGKGETTLWNRILSRLVPLHVWSLNWPWVICIKVTLWDGLDCYLHFFLWQS